MSEAKRCGKCQAWKPVTDFSKRAASHDGLQASCKACVSLYRNPRHSRNGHLMRAYGISLAQYEQMLSDQAGGCLACRKGPKENGTALVVDHDHSCCPGGKTCGRCIRGLLCHDCNTGIGKLRDDPALLRRMADYIENHQNNVLEIAA